MHLHGLLSGPPVPERCAMLRQQGAGTPSTSAVRQHAPCQRRLIVTGSYSRNLGRNRSGSKGESVNEPLSDASSSEILANSWSEEHRGPASPGNGANALPDQQLQPAPSTSAPATLTLERPRPFSAPADPAAVDEDVLIELRGAHKSFGSKKILNGTSIKIRRGEAVGIIGGSGTGKSTTLRLMAGLLAPDHGNVYILGRKREGLLADDDSSDKLHVGMVFQNGALFDSLTVGENVGFLLYEHSTLPKPRIQELVADALAKVGLSGVERLYPAELSGGMKKRVALARAIIRADDDTTEQVIMYDEPTAGLDPVASTVIEDLIRSLHKAPRHESEGGSAAEEEGGISAYIVVTHQHSTIRRSVDRLIFLFEGRVVWEGTVEEFDTTDEPIVRQFASGSLNGPIEYV